MSNVESVIQELEQKKTALDQQKAAIDLTILHLRRVFNGHVPAEAAEPSLVDTIEEMVYKTGRAGLRRKFLVQNMCRDRAGCKRAIAALMDGGIIKQVERPGGGNRPFLFLLHKKFAGPQKPVRVRGLVVKKKRARRRTARPEFTLYEMLKEVLEPGARYNAQAAVGLIKKKYNYKPKRQSVLAEMNRLMHLGIMKRLEKGLYYFPETPETEDNKPITQPEG